MVCCFLEAVCCCLGVDTASSCDVYVTDLYVMNCSNCYGRFSCTDYFILDRCGPCRHDIKHIRVKQSISSLHSHQTYMLHSTTVSHAMKISGKTKGSCLWSNVQEVQRDNIIGALLQHSVCGQRCQRITMFSSAKVTDYFQHHGPMSNSEPAV